MIRRYEPTYAPFLTLLLFFIVLNLGSGFVVIYNITPERLHLMAALHFFFAFAGAALLALFGTVIAGRGKALADKVIVCLLIVTAIFVLGGNVFAIRVPPDDFIHVLMPSVLGIAWPVTLHAFFSLTPARLQGVLFFGAFALGELVWLLLSPGMRMQFADVQTIGIIGSLYKLQAIMQGALALVCAYAYSRLPHFCLDQNPFTPSPKSFRAAICCLLGLFCIQLLLGVVFGPGFLKTSRHLMMLENAHYILLACLPLAGLVLDRARAGTRLILLGLGCLAFAGPAAAFMEGGTERLLLSVFAAVRQLFYLSTLVLLGRVMGKSRYFPLLCCALYAMLGASYLGASLGSLAARFPGGVTGTALALAGFSACCLFVLSKLPEIQPLHPAQPDFKAGEHPVAPDLSRLPAFAAAFSLTPREEEVLTGLLQGQSLDLIAKRFEITESTVKYHLTRLLRKTQCANRRSLLTKYRAWQNQI